jgi:xanthosine utilization system XapX-like protein
MKVINIIGHPIAVMCTYLLLLISGQSFGGFYVLYILLGLPHGSPDAIISASGLGIMLLGYKVYRNVFNPIKPLLYFVGIVVMIFGLVFFFQSSKGYNNQTFHQTVPLISFTLFGLCALCNVLHSVGLFFQDSRKKDNHLNIAS